MSGKLDQSLDQIMQDSGSTGKRRGGRQGTRRAAQKAKAAIAAPTGGVQKSTRAPKATGKAPAMAAPKAPAPNSSKVMISGLPLDVNENQVKDYVTQTVGPVRSIFIAYGPDGRSRGMATLIFSNPAAATKAVRTINGVKIDGRPIKVEMIMDGTSVAAQGPIKSLAERMSKPKSAAKEPKAAKAAPKAKGAAAPATNGTTSKEGAKGKKGGRANRPKKKTADELDAEMQDYFGNESAPANGAAQPAAAAPATNGAEPVDEVM